MPADEFINSAAEFISEFDWYKADETFFTKVASHMQSRTKLFSQIETWSYYYTEGVEFVYETDEAGELTQTGNKFKKDVRKTLTKEGVADNLQFIAEKLDAVSEFTAENIETAAGDASEECGAGRGRLNKAIRMAVTAVGGGAELYPTLELIGKERVINRLKTCAGRDCKAEG